MHLTVRVLYGFIERHAGHILKLHISFIYNFCASWMIVQNRWFDSLYFKKRKVVLSLFRVNGVLSNQM